MNRAEPQRLSYRDDYRAGKEYDRGRVDDAAENKQEQVHDRKYRKLVAQACQHRFRYSRSKAAARYEPCHGRGAR